MTVGAQISQRDMRIVIELVRHHLSGLLVTTSSLAASSGLSYGTAMRAIDAMLAAKLIVARPRTSTGLSYSLHPSGDLISRGHAFSHRGERLLHDVTTVAENERSPVRRRWPPDVAAGIIPPPAVSDNKLSLGRALRVLVHADTTFMAMSALKRQLKFILGVPIELMRGPSLRCMRRSWPTAGGRNRAMTSLPATSPGSGRWGITVAFCRSTG